MDVVIKEMPVDRAPGPDGFNGISLRGARILLKVIFIN
jgi:hypothetical protein